MGTAAAGIYMYTTDSAFNQLSMSDYMSHGTPVTPLSAESQFAAFHNLSLHNEFNISSAHI